jgi:hypothetical protein
MSQSEQVLIFETGSKIRDIEVLAAEFPFKQTQALILAMDEATAWIEMAQEMIGAPAPDCLEKHAKWLEFALTTIQELDENLEDEVDDDLTRCNQRADDEYFDAIGEVLMAYPDYGIDPDECFEEGLADAFDRMLVFWLDHTRNHLARVQGVMSGAEDVMAMLSRQKKLGAISA